MYHLTVTKLFGLALDNEPVGPQTWDHFSAILGTAPDGPVRLDHWLVDKLTGRALLDHDQTLARYLPWIN